MTLAPGSRLGAYEVLSALGSGGMGEVYRARDTRLNREVAIKVLPAERLADEHRRRRFHQEARALSSLNHPHIVTIYEVESAGDHDFIVMELVRGSSLDQLIPSRGLPVRQLLRIAVPVAEALAAAHARGIIHRDVKPANLMVGDDGVVKVLDFGVAKLLEPEWEPRCRHRDGPSARRRERVRANCGDAGVYGARASQPAERSTRAATCSASGRCCTSWPPARARSTATRQPRPWPRCSLRSRRHRRRSPTYHGSWSG